MPENIQFSMGWELEATGGVRDDDVPEGIILGSDGSVHGDGLEYRLCERVVDDPEKGLMLLRRLVSFRDVTVDNSCGFHVHLALRNNQEKSRLWAAWLVALARHVEDEAFDAAPISRRGNSYCRKWDGVVVQDGTMKTKFYHCKSDNALRYQWLNVVEIFRPNGIRTVEFRLMGDTKRFSILMAWIAACMEMSRGAYFLIEDPSRMDVEISEIRRTFRKVKRVRLNSGGEGVQLAVELARKVGLLRPADISGGLSAVNDTERRILMTDEENQAFRDRYHVQQPDPVYGGYRSPRIPVRGCHCFECQDHREERNRRRAQREMEEAREQGEGINLGNPNLVRVTEGNEEHSETDASDEPVTSGSTTGGGPF